MKEYDTPLAVDLDGSLIYSDMLYETFVRVVFKKPWLVFFIVPWLLKGRSHLKLQLARQANVDVSVLPYNTELLEYLKTQSHRSLILCTATTQELADKIAGYLGVFSETIGSSQTQNLAGSEKAKVLCDRFGNKGFSYVGNETRDLKIWKYADSAVVVGEESLASKVSKFCDVEQKVAPRRLSIKVLAKAFRLHQWVKNALIFVPLITSHQITDFNLFKQCFIAFIAFGLCASATYIINDISDLDSDRKHHKKRYRPIAAGLLKIQDGIFLAAFMLLLAGVIAFSVNAMFLLVLVGYTAMTLSYSFLLKRLQTVDIIALAALYTLRIIAGGAVIGVTPSFWLLSFSMFVFLALAIVKRISEVLKKLDSKNTNEGKISGRGYYASDIDILRGLATSSGMVSILVFAMYIQSSDVVALYASPERLWLVCPIFAYWIMRLLIMAARGQVDEDPISFALKDSRSWFAGGAIAVAIIFAV